MLLLVGLGNPSPDNEHNRHNIGFRVIDAINQEFSLSKQKPKFKGLLTTGKIDDKKVYAIKPLTFMNNSGQAIRELIEYFKIDSKNVFVFHDDLDIEFGKIKTKFADFNGTVVPAYTLNTVLGKVPVLGDLLLGGKGEGVFAITYAIKGPLEKPRVTVNPLSALAPGFLRGIVSILTPKPSAPIATARKPPGP